MRSRGLAVTVAALLALVGLAGALDGIFEALGDGGDENERAARRYTAGIVVVALSFVPVALLSRRAAALRFTLLAVAAAVAGALAFAGVAHAFRTVWADHWLDPASAIAAACFGGAVALASEGRMSLGARLAVAAAFSTLVAWVSVAGLLVPLVFPLYLLVDRLARVPATSSG